MSDPTTDGVEATAAEIEGMVRNLCAYALGEPDPIQRYESLTHQQVLFQGMVEALRRERGRMVADLVVAGLSVTEVAAQTSLGTVVKVRKLVSLAGETQRVQEATAARKAADLEARLKARDANASQSLEPSLELSLEPSPEPSPELLSELLSELSGPSMLEPLSEMLEPSLLEPSLLEQSPLEQSPLESSPSRFPVPAPLEREPRPEMMLLLEPEPLPLHLAAPTGTRLLTPEELAALGLPAEGVKRIRRGV